MMGMMGRARRGAAALGTNGETELGSERRKWNGWVGKRGSVWAMANRRRCRWWGAEESEAET